MKKSILLLLIATGACSRFENQENVPAPKRAVCIAKQYTEIIFALGAGESLSAVDVSSTYPPAAKQLPTVGYHRALSIEALLAVKPELIIHDDNIGPDHVVTQMRQLKIPELRFRKHTATIAGTDSLIREIGAYFGKEAQADSLCDKLRADMASLPEVPHGVKRPRVCIIHYGQASNAYLTMTAKSTAARMVEWAGGEMSLQGTKGMLPLSAEVVAAYDPDVVLLTDFGYDRLGSHADVTGLPGISGTRAAHNNRIYRVEEHDMVYLGPRTGENIRNLHKLIFDGQ